jgi:hypothetical protein
MVLLPRLIIRLLVLAHPIHSFHLAWMNTSTQLLELMDSGAFFQYEVCHMQTFSVTCGNFVKRSELNIIFCCQSPSVSQKFLLYRYRLVGQGRTRQWSNCCFVESFVSLISIAS